MRCFVCREVPAPDGFACRRCAQQLEHDERLNHAIAVLDDMQHNGAWPTDDITAYIERLQES